MFIKSSIGSGGPGKKTVRHKPGQLLPVQNSAQLLSAKVWPAQLDYLRQHSGLPDEHFSGLYVAFINRFAEQVQLMPSQPHGALSGLLNEGLARAMVALQQFIAQSDLSADPLLRYAVFSAALLADVGKLIINQRVILTSDQAEFVDYWYPLEGSMLRLAPFYRLLPLAPIYQRLDYSATILLARQLLPELAYMWLSSDLAVYADWLDALGSRVDSGVITRTLSYIRLEDWRELFDQFNLLPFDILETPETSLAEQFLLWLRDAIEHGEVKLNTNESGVYLVPEGVLLEQKVFKQFAEVMSKNMTWDVVYQQFGNLMGIPKRGAHDYVNAKYFSRSGQSYLAGITASFGAQSNSHQGFLLTEPGLIISKRHDMALSRLQNADPQGRHPLPVRNRAVISSSIQPDKKR